MVNITSLHIVLIVSSSAIQAKIKERSRRAITSPQCGRNLIVGNPFDSRSWKSWRTKQLEHDQHKRFYLLLFSIFQERAT
jgi:hypothetical protein